ncbi:MAG: CysS/YqeB C-terminal domain-containing protein, partial [Acidimicrobiales bacterium]
ASPAGAGTAVASASPLPAVAATRDAEFAAGVAARDVPVAVRALLGLDGELEAWSRETFSSDEMAGARSVYRSMIVRLGELAGGGMHDRAEVVGPFVEALLQQRASARTAQRWADADAIRDQLVALGIDVRDGPEGTTWALLS